MLYRIKKYIILTSLVIFSNNCYIERIKEFINTETKKSYYILYDNHNSKSIAENKEQCSKLLLYLNNLSTTLHIVTESTAFNGLSSKKSDSNYYALNNLVLNNISLKECDEYYSSPYNSTTFINWQLPLILNFLSHKSNFNANFKNIELVGFDPRNTIDNCLNSKNINSPKLKYILSKHISKIFRILKNETISHFIRSNSKFNEYATQLKECLLKTITSSNQDLYTNILNLKKNPLSYSFLFDLVLFNVAYCNLKYNNNNFMFLVGFEHGNNLESFLLSQNFKLKAEYNAIDDFVKTLSLDSEIDQKIIKKLFWNNTELNKVLKITKQYSNIQHSSNYFNGLLQKASAFGEPKEIDILLSFGAHINNGQDRYNNTSLHAAAITQNKINYNYLISKQANDNQFNAIGISPEGFFDEKLKSEIEKRLKLYNNKQKFIYKYDVYCKNGASFCHAMQKLIENQNIKDRDGLIKASVAAGISFNNLNPIGCSPISYFNIEDLKERDYLNFILDKDRDIVRTICNNNEKFKEIAKEFPYLLLNYKSKIEKNLSTPNNGFFKSLISIAENQYKNPLYRETNEESYEILFKDPDKANNCNFESQLISFIEKDNSIMIDMILEFSNLNLILQEMKKPRVNINDEKVNNILTLTHRVIELEKQLKENKKIDINLEKEKFILVLLYKRLVHQGNFLSLQSLLSSNKIYVTLSQLLLKITINHDEIDLNTYFYNLYPKLNTDINFEINDFYEVFKEIASFIKLCSNIIEIDNININNFNILSDRIKSKGIESIYNNNLMIDEDQNEEESLCKKISKQRELYEWLQRNLNISSLSQIESLLKDNPNLFKYIDPIDDRTWLIVAEYNKVELAKVIIKYNKNFSIILKTDEDESPLMLAMDKKLIKLLIKNGADVNEEPNALSDLLYCLEYNNIDTKIAIEKAKILIKFGASLKEIDSLKNINIKPIKKLIKNVRKLEKDINNINNILYDPQLGTYLKYVFNRALYLHNPKMLKKIVNNPVAFNALKATLEKNNKIISLNALEIIYSIKNKKELNCKNYEELQSLDKKFNKWLYFKKLNENLDYRRTLNTLFSNKSNNNLDIFSNNNDIKYKIISYINKV